MANTPNLSNLAQSIGRLSIQEKHELFCILEETYNVNIQSVLAFVPIPTYKNEFNNDGYVGDIYPLDNPKGSGPVYQLVLMDCGRSKLQVVKTIKELTQLGLKESMELTNKVPSIIYEVRDYAQAEGIQRTFEHLGAEMDIHQIDY